MIRFWDGNENVEDDECSGQRAAIWTPDMIETVQELIQPIIEWLFEW
jgi:hypothetical protein